MGTPPLYGKNWEAKMASSVDDFINQMVTGKASVDNFESFFYGVGGHAYTTNEVRELLKNGKDKLVINSDINITGDIYEYKFNYPSFTPVLLTINFSKYAYDGKIKIFWMTENRDVYAEEYLKEVDLKNKYGLYQTILPAGGRRLRQLKIVFINNPRKVSIKSITFKSLSLTELTKMNYCK